LDRAWAEWVQYLSEKEGKPLTPARAKRHRASLSPDPATAIRQLHVAIERNYSAPAKPDKLPPAPATPETKTERDRRFAEERRQREELYGTGDTP
jgi:hypothetical protein